MSGDTGDVTRRLTEAIGRVIAQTLNSEGGTSTSNDRQHHSTLQQNTSAGEPAATEQTSTSNDRQHHSTLRQNSNNTSAGIIGLPMENVHDSNGNESIVSIGDDNRRAGRPRKIINRDDLAHLLQLKIPISEIARRLSVSRSTIYNSIDHHGINYERFSSLSQAEIESEIQTIKNEHPNAGEVMLQGHLTSKGLHVQREKVRQALHVVDPEGVEERKRKPIRRRVYTNPFPNYVWHIDGNHKIVRWRMVIHHGIDGFSRLVLFAKCSSNNRAETAHNVFVQALPKYGRPVRVRTDLGGENVNIWRDMIAFRGEANVPVLVGKSVHNQRIERHNRALNEQVLSTFRRQFYELESQGALDVNNDTDIFCLHCVYLPRINKALDEFVAAHNSHRISTENNRTPEQLFWCNITLADQYEGTLPQHPNQPSIEELTSRDLPHVCVPDTPNPLGEENDQCIQDLVISLEGQVAMDAYREVVRFVGE